MILSFNRPDYFRKNLTDNHQLCAFALGAELSSVYTLIGNKREIALGSLHEQNRLETIAKQCYEDFMKDPMLHEVLVNYAAGILDSDTTIFNDVHWHAQTPGLPLAKYYSALKHTEGHIDRSVIWEEHLKWCQSLSLALYEYCIDPLCTIDYEQKTVMINKPHTKQCFCYTDIKTPVVFNIDQYQYVQLPWPKSKRHKKRWL
ncbi:MAG TPA: hypothetical protein DEV85_08060 [Vibrio sp.]|uniref:hypothetical protein n=1 Tax=Vibrio sp. TaxID=678 RepID=UPI000EDC5BAF|nr:hypothetical protein [Vibrio sp.]HCH01828.1 hypothetical protein [Vibrio sp.]